MFSSRPKRNRRQQLCHFLGGGGGGGGGRGLSIMFYVKMVIVYHCYKKKGKPGWKKRKHDFLGRCSRKFLGAKEHLKRQPCFIGKEYSNRKFVFPFFKAIFKTSFRPSRSFFSINGTYCTNGKGDFGTKFTSPEFCARFTRQTVARPVFFFFFCRPK